MDFKNLNKAIVSMKYNNKPKTKEPREERTRSQEKIIHELAKFKEGVEEKKRSFRNEDGFERAQRRMGIDKNTVTQRTKKRKAHKMKQK